MTSTLPPSNWMNKRPFLGFSVAFVLLMPYLLWLALRHRTIAFFTLANPGIPFGGLAPHSKYELNIRLPQALRAKSQRLSAQTSVTSVLEWMHEQGLRFPIVGKPDQGAGGRGVQVLKTPEALKHYLHSQKGEIIIEEYLKYDAEYAVFYHRLPHHEKGEISSLVQKIFLYAEGDGHSTIGELIDRQSGMTKKQKVRIRQHLFGSLSSVPLAGTKVKLTELGNCADGVRVQDLSHEITPVLEAIFDEISLGLEGFCYGRFDILANSINDLNHGQFKIIELNGACAIPLHIYASDVSYLRSLAELAHYSTIMSKIARSNRQDGFEPSRVWTVIKATRPVKPAKLVQLKQKQV
jgi:hypothetical protein